jgi:hypothetical protein
MAIVKFLRAVGQVQQRSPSRGALAIKHQGLRPQPWIAFPECLAEPVIWRASARPVAGNDGTPRMP